MKTVVSKIKIVQVAALFAIIVFAFGCKKSDLNPAIPGETTLSQQTLKVPNVPAEIAVPEGNKLIFHCYASGVQIYQVTESSTNPGQYVWTLIAPSATLYNNQNFTKQVGTHYAGPTWESKFGTKKSQYVIGTKINSVTVDPTAVGWLLLQAVPNSDPNYFSSVTYIHRLYTTGGLAPTTGATAENLGIQQSVPYTAEYYFYAAE